MKKLRFKMSCKDKYIEGLVYCRDCEYWFEDERADEVLATGYAFVVDTKQEESQEIDNLEEALEQGKMVNLHDLTVAELKKLAKEEGVSARGTKDEIVERIMAKQEETEEE